MERKDLIRLILLISLPILLIAAVVTAIYLYRNRKPTTDEMQDLIDDVVEGYDEEDQETYNRVEEIVDLGPDSIPLLLDLLDEDDIYSKWTAIYCLSRVGYDEDSEVRNDIIDELKKEFTNTSPSIATMAAGVAVAFGDKSGVPVLIDSLDNQDMLFLTEPPMLVCQYSHDTLSAYFPKHDFGDSCNWETTDEDSNEEVVTWWSANQSSLKWNDKDKTYKAE